MYFGHVEPVSVGRLARSARTAGCTPAPSRYTDSLVVLDGKTGKLLWYDQVTPHDVRDYDFQLSPILSATPCRCRQGRARDRLATEPRTSGSGRRRSERHRNDDGSASAEDRSRSARACSAGSRRRWHTPTAACSCRSSTSASRRAPSASSGFAFYATDYSKGTGELVALDAVERRPASGRDASRRPNFGCATVAGNVVFTATYDGNVYGLSTATARPCCTRGRGPGSTLPGRRRPHAARRRGDRPPGLSQRRSSS